MLSPDSAERAILLARELATREVTDEVWYQDLAVRQGLLAVSLAHRGHLREARDVIRKHEEELAGWGLYTELALAAVISADTADRFFRRHLSHEPFWPASALRFAPPWWAARGDTSSLKRYIGRLGSRTAADPDLAQAAADRSWLAPISEPYWLASSQVYLALARRDTVGALRRLAALPDSLGTVWFERLTWARLLLAQGSPREAFIVLDRGFPYPYPIGSRGLWELERTRLADRLGETEKARYLYSYVVHLWRTADPELQPAVTEAREALKRLTAERER
jgi:hypothetical protein